MADEKISDLSEGSPLQSTDELLIARSGANNKILASTVTGVLTWNGTDYAPSQLKASTLPKKFIGPTDPTTVTGVVLNLYDLWDQTQ